MTDGAEVKKTRDLKKLESILLVTSPLLYLLWKNKDLLSFLDKQGEIKKADEEFFVSIFKAAKENGVDRFKLKLNKEQLSGLDITIKKAAAKIGVDCDFGIKGSTNIELDIIMK